MNIQNLVLDINKKCNQLVTANVGEVDSRLLKISVIDNGVPMDLTGITVYLYAKKADSTKVFNTVKVENAKQGIVSAEITSQVLAIEGFVKLTLLLTKDKARLASKIFTLKVDETIVDDEALESSNEFKALDLALGKANEWNGYFEETSGKIEEKYTERLNQVDSQLAHHTSRLEGFVNAKEFGMSEDNEDNTAILQQLVDNASTIIIPKGTYKFKSGITISNPIEIDGNNCNFIFEGEGSFITLMSSNLIFNRMTMQSSKGRDSETLQVCFDAGNADKVNRQIRFNYINVNGFSDSAFLLNTQWHITLKHCTIGKCGAFNVDNLTGGIVIRGEQMTPSWNGSGNIIEDCYISGCNYGLYSGGGWNVQLNNVIFEYNNYPIRKGVGRYISTNRCWFEGNYHDCYGGGINSVGDRFFGVEADSINDIYELYEKPGSEGVYGADNNPYFEMKDGKITKFTLHTDSGVRTAFDKNGTQHLTISKGTVIAGEGGGSVNAGKPAHENSMLRLAGYGGYWATTVEKWNTPLCALDLNYTSSNVGSGQGYGGFDFKASQVNGSTVSRELLSVFGVNSNGTISPMQLDGTADIGTKTAKYNNIYCNAMVLCSPNGTFFKVTVNDDGTLNTTKF